MDEFLTHLDLPFSRELLLKEANNGTEFKPFDSVPNTTSWFNKPSTWLVGKVDDVTICPEVNRLLAIIKARMDCVDVRPRYYKQEANTEVPLHADINTLCSVNIILVDDFAPIIFEEIGEVTYKCALLNISKAHAVPPHPEIRYLLKYSIFDKTYEEARKCWLT